MASTSLPTPLAAAATSVAGSTSGPIQRSFAYAAASVIQVLIRIDTIGDHVAQAQAEVSKALRRAPAADATAAIALGREKVGLEDRRQPNDDRRPPRVVA